MMTAAKMVLHDWQRGKIPFFVQPPKQEEDSLEEPNESGLERESAVDDNRAAAARKASANIISSQQEKDVPVQKDLFSEGELKGETCE